MHLCVLLCLSLKKGTRFGAMVIHSGTMFEGLHYSAVSHTFMSTSMERDDVVRPPSPPLSLSQPRYSLLALPEAKWRHRGGHIHCLRRCRSHVREAGRHGPPSLRPPVVHLNQRTGHHLRGWHRGQDVPAHGADPLHGQRQSRGPKERALRRLRHAPVRTRRSATLSPHLVGPFASKLPSWVGMR